MYFDELSNEAKRQVIEKLLNRVANKYKLHIELKINKKHLNELVNKIITKDNWYIELDKECKKLETEIVNAIINSKKELELAVN